MAMAVFVNIDKIYNYSPIHALTVELVERFDSNDNLLLIKEFANNWFL